MRECFSRGEVKRWRGGKVLAVERWRGEDEGRF